MLTAAAITKRFAAVTALDAVDFAAHRGEIHALLGENGAGKTTLMKVFAGLLRPDVGEIALDGKSLRSGSPQAALDAGIATVNQSPLLFERFTWEENLELGGFGAATAAERAHAIATTLGFELPPRATRVERLSVAERVRLEVIRALSFDPRVLILDEPTGVFAPNQVAAFLDSLRRLRDQGRIVVLITHKLREAMAVADRITVMRNGRRVIETSARETTEADLARLMIGELPVAPEPSAKIRPGEPVLEIDSLTVARDGRNILDRVTMALRAGEIAGIAGVDGNGQTELIEVLAGVQKPDAGRIAMASGPAMAVIPQDRDLDGLILDMALWENLMLARELRRRATIRGWLSPKIAQALCAGLLDRFQIRAAGPNALAGELSGGNRQRLAVARAIAIAPRIIAAHNITRGLDLGATAAVHRILRSFVADGGSVLLISSDLDELITLTNRLMVLSRGRLTEVAPEQRDPTRLGLLMAGAPG